jgi:signal transduction histidine kinase
MIVTNDARNLSNSGRANLRRAQGAIQKMKLVTEDLISFSKLHEVDTKADRVDLDKILHSAINDFITRPNHPPIEINCDHLPAIVGYPLLLPVLFHHLLDNAIKFRKADEEHVINVTCADRVSGDDVNIDGVVKNFNYTVISVGDNGIGFPGEESEKIFNMFYQLHEKGKYKGSGNGLAICKKIMEMHGGFISAKGTPGEGSSFHCYFPG